MSLVEGDNTLTANVMPAELTLRKRHKIPAIGDDAGGATSSGISRESSITK